MLNGIQLVNRVNGFLNIHLKNGKVFEVIC